ncbi:MAG: hypothetical protein ACWIPJ_00805 [Polaribacter sp.]
MKNKTNIIGFLFISIFLMYSCDENKEIGIYNVGAEPILKTTNISTFDINHKIDIEYLLRKGVTVTSASYNDTKITNQNLTVTGNMVSFNTSIKDSLAREFNIVTMLSNGIETRKTMKIVVHSPVNISEDTFVIEEDVDVDVDKKDAAIVFTNKVSSATINKTTTQWKKGKNGTFATTTAPDLSLNLANPKSKDSIDLRTFDYTALPYNLMKRDTLFLRVISESGQLKDTINTKLIFSPQSFVEYTVGKTLTNKSGANLLDDKNKNLDLFLDATANLLLIKNNKFKYVDISNETKAYKEDLLKVEDYVAVYDKFAAGTKTSNAIPTTSLAKGNLYIYSVERTLKVKGKADKVITHYGLLSIGSITKVNVDGEVKTSIEINSKEGEGVKK